MDGVDWGCGIVCRGVVSDAYSCFFCQCGLQRRKSEMRAVMITAAVIRDGRWKTDMRAMLEGSG